MSSELLKKAHKLTRELKTEYPEVDYQSQLGICIKFLLKEKEEKIMTWETVSAAMETAVKEKDMSGWYCNNWKKGDYDRSYLELRWYRNGKLKQTIKCGYWDNVAEQYITEDRYNKIYNVITKETK